jgi:Tfp pilus assembly protein PilF
MGLMNLLIKFSRADQINYGVTTLSGRYYDETVQVFPELASKDFILPDQAIGVFTHKDERYKPAYLLKLNSYQRGERKLKVFYSISDILNISSDEVLSSAQRRLIGDGKIDRYGQLPFWCVLDDLQFEYLLNPGMDYRKRNALTLKDRLLYLKEQELWYKMYDPFKPVEKISENQPKVWNDPGALRYIAYAAGKLAEINSIPTDVKYDLFRRNEYLNDKRLKRADVEFLLKRCMELDPKNPVYHSDLGNLHYRNVEELTARKGRNDGDPLFELEEAVQCFQKAVELDPNRITDMFRMGYLLTVKYREVIQQSSRKKDSEQDKDLKIIEGIEVLEKLINRWQRYKDYDPKQKELKEAYKKEYIQSLACLGMAYDELSAIDWNATDFYLGIYHIPDFNLRRDVLENTENALKYYVACWNAECETGCLPNAKLSDCVSPNWIVNGIDKLTNLGHSNLKLYVVYSMFGMKDEAENCLNDAEFFLNEAMESDLSFVKIKPKEPILDLLAKVYISQGKYDQAIATVRKHTNKRRLGGMLTNTYALALILSKQYEEALHILERASADITNRYGMVATFLLGMLYTVQGSLDAAQELFKKAVRHKYKDRLEAKDLFYIGLALSEQKLGNKRTAGMYYKKVSGSEIYRRYSSIKMEELKQKRS